MIRRAWKGKHATPSGAPREDSGAPDERLLERRRLLQAALGGGIAIAGSQVLLAPPLEASTGGRADEFPDWATADAFGGTVRDVHAGVATIDTGAPGSPVLRDVTFTSTSETWYRGVMGSRLPAVGDDVVIRSVIPGQVQYAWINRVSFDAAILSQTGSGLDVAIRHPGSGAQQNLAVTIGDQATWYDAVTGAPGPGTDRLASAHILGFQAGSSVVATELWYATIRDVDFLAAHPPASPKPKTVKVGPSFCVKSWRGNTSYFRCPTGAGACGTCNTGSNSQSAWPYVVGHANCDNGCTSQCSLKCGDPFLFYKCESGSGASLKVVDLGPCQRSGDSCGTCNPSVCGYGCSGDPCRLGGPKPRILDLTAPTMARFYGGAGCAACTVGIYCPCSDCTCPY